jgi:hypothetical protein
MRTTRVALLFLVVACGDTNDAKFDGWTLPTLQNAEGFSLRVPAFDVEPGKEVQNCYFVRVPDIANGGPVWINRVQAATNPGSHHLNVFRVKTIIGLDPANGVPIDLGPDGVSIPATLIEGAADYATNPCWLSANWADWPLVANDQESNTADPYFDWTLPKDVNGNDVAVQLQPGELLMVQTHYVNSTDQATPFGARIGINFYRSTSAQQTELGTLFATQQHIRICQSDPVVSFSGTCRLPGAVTVTAANGHFHSRGKEFDIFNWDGVSTTEPTSAMFYQSLNWDEPPMSTGLTVPIQPTGGIFWTCTYEWHQPTYTTCDAVNAKDPLQQNDCCYTFGGDTDIGEHCNVFAYYYPRGTGDVFCN